MRSSSKRGPLRKRMVAGCLFAATLVPSWASAEEAASNPQPAPPPAGGGGQEPAVAAQATMPQPTASPPPPAMPPAMVATMPPAPAPDMPLKLEPTPIKTVFGLRVGGRIQGSGDPSKLNDISLDTLYLEARFSGALNKYFAWQANFNGNAKPAATSGPASIMDLIVKVDADDAFHVWAGRLLVPSDRSNFSGPFFISPWNYPGSTRLARPAASLARRPEPLGATTALWSGASSSGERPSISWEHSTSTTSNRVRSTPVA